MTDLRDLAGPFRRAAAREWRRLKLLLWGDSGVGKTTLALQFPNPAVVDLEGGTVHYADAFDFDVLPANTVEDVMQAVQWLQTNEHGYRTLVVDPISLFWESLQRHWSEVFLRRNQGSKGFRFEYYDLQAKDWTVIKGQFKAFVRQLNALDVNVICTAREKPLYAEGGFMRREGETFDCEKSTPYMFDTVLRLSVDEQGRRLATNLKDRTGKLPSGTFEVSYALFEQAFGRDALGRKAERPVRASEEQVRRIRELATGFGLTDEQVNGRLPEYGATALEELTEENAAVITAKLEAAAVAAPAKNRNAKEGE